MIIGFKGRWANKQFNASKPHKYHIKTFGLCDSLTGYVYNLLLYYGKDTSYDPECDTKSLQAEKVFQTLLTNIGKGHTIFADRYYTALPVVDYLSSRGLYFTGTLQVTRKGVPQELKTRKLEHKETRWYMGDDNKILCVAWRDKKAKKPCVLVSTNANAEMKTVRANGGEASKPAMVVEYNQAMNGFDAADQNISYYGVHECRSKKWWKKIIFWLLEITQVNAHILYTLAHPNDKRVELRKFKSTLVEEMEFNITLNNNVDPAKSVSCERFVTSKMPLIHYDGRDGNCVACSGPGGGRKRTVFVCSGRSDRPFLHPKNCFYKYHTHRNA
ncbi:piggyBac transposable element-derived protein 4-like [Aplysia californica]|uniref:PiggyBac transposable element-derived protein 4-like n=1 Tax=Aplysia californica TaxID=6500 RepID=A0ABM1VQN9_APLCA|nr:piggyBac transposable element-derived protein 4-like [Aplysia californica]